MKKIISYILGAAAAVMLLNACKKDTDHQEKSVDIFEPAYIKFIQVAPSFRQVFNGADSFDIFVDDAKINGPFLTFNSGFPVLTSNTNTYSAFRAGTKKISFVSNVTKVPILFFQRTLEKSEKYSLIITDSLDRDNQYSSIWLKDDFSIPDTGKIALRFVNAVVNDTAGKTVDLYSKRYAQNIFTNVAVRGASAFTLFPYTTLSDTLFVRRSGTLNTLATLNTASFSARRVYTVLYKGSTVATGTKGKNILSYNNY